MKPSIFIGVSLFVLVSLNWLIVDKELILHSGRTILCELGPRDPRSIMQGDYMVLRYVISREAANALPRDRFDGGLVVSIDNNDVASFQRLDDGGALAANEARIRFRRRNSHLFSRDSVWIGAESYFFQEGRAQVFAQARYGELKVAANGETVLIGLRDANRRPL